MLISSDLILLEFYESSQKPLTPISDYYAKDYISKIYSSSNLWPIMTDSRPEYGVYSRWRLIKDSSILAKVETTVNNIYVSTVLSSYHFLFPNFQPIYGVEYPFIYREVYKPVTDLISDEKNLKSILYQVVLSLCCAQKDFGLVHGSLTVDSVSYFETDSISISYQVNGTTVTLKDVNCVAVISNFDEAKFDQQETSSDIFTFFASIYSHCSDHSCPDIITKLLSMFIAPADIPAVVKQFFRYDMSYPSSMKSVLSYDLFIRIFLSDSIVNEDATYPSKLLDFNNPYICFSSQLPIFITQESELKLMSDYTTALENYKEASEKYEIIRAVTYYNELVDIQTVISYFKENGFLKSVNIEMPETETVEAVLQSYLLKNSPI